MSAFPWNYFLLKLLMYYFLVQFIWVMNLIILMLYWQNVNGISQSLSVHVCVPVYYFVHVYKKKKKKQVIVSALCHLLCNSKRPQHTLQMFVDHCGPRQTITWETINQGLLQPQGELYPIQTIFNHRSRDQLLEFRTSFYETISSEFLVLGNFKHTQFSREHWSLTGLELATSRTQSERRIDWANLTAIHYRIWFMCKFS